MPIAHCFESPSYAVKASAIIVRYPSGRIGEAMVPGYISRYTLVFQFQNIELTVVARVMCQASR